MNTKYALAHIAAFIEGGDEEGEVTQAEAFAALDYLRAELAALTSRLKEAEDRAASLEALDAEAQIGADEVSRQLRELKAELASVRAQWAADVGSAVARALTAEDAARRAEQERDAARAEAARLRDVLTDVEWIDFEDEEVCPMCNALKCDGHMRGCDVGAALRGPAQSENGE